MTFLSFQCGKMVKIKDQNYVYFFILRGIFKIGHGMGLFKRILNFGPEAEILAQTVSQLLGHNSKIASIQYPNLTTRAKKYSP